MFQFISVALNAPVEFIKKILEKGADPNIKSNNGITALMTAVLNKNISAVALLVDYGANIDDVTQDSVSAMTLAMSSNAEVRCYIATG